MIYPTTLSLISRNRNLLTRVTYATEGFKRLYLILIAIICGCGVMPTGVVAQVTANWVTNNNGNWDASANWAGEIIPNGVGDIALFNNNITATRTITNNLGTITLGGITFATPNTGDFGYTVQTGTLRFENTDGVPAVINLNNAGGGSATINSDLIIVDQLDINLVPAVRNSRGLTLGTTGTAGVISGGTSGQTTIRINATEAAADFVSWVLMRGDNTFEGQILVESGHLRLETRPSSAGARGLGNEVIVNGTGTVDLRGVNFAVQADDTQIFQVEGAGPNGLGSLVNTTGVGSISHLILSGNATVGGQAATNLLRRRSTANDADIPPIFDMGGHSVTKLGISEFRLYNADIQNAAGAVWNIHEGIVKFENRGALDGGGLIGGTTYGNNVDGMTFNVNYVAGAFDGVDPLNGSRTSDVFNPNRAASDLLGYPVAPARLSFRTDWAAGNTHALNTKVVDSWDNVTVNLNNGMFVREGNTEMGRTFDHVFGAGSKFNLVGGTMGQNLFTLSGGSGLFNTDLNQYDHPGVTEIQGELDNSSGLNLGEGFTKRGNRELRLSNANAGFTGEVLIKQSTGRFMPTNFHNASGEHESQYFSLSLAGADGTLNQASAIELTRWGSLALLNSDTEGGNNRGGFVSANNNDRLNDGGFLNFRNGVLYLEMHSTETNTENMGNVRANLGTNYLYLDTRAGGSFDGALASLGRAQGGVLKIASLNRGHDWGVTGTDEVRLAVTDVTGMSLVGADSPGTVTQRVVQGLFGGVVPTFAARTDGGSTRSDFTMEQAAAYWGTGLGLMTVEGSGGTSYLRPLRADEYHFGGMPVANANWVVNEFIQPVGGPYGFGDRLNYEGRQITADTTINSLTIAWDALASGQTMVNTERDYLIIEQGSKLKIDSGIINFATIAEVDITANATASVRGGQLDLNGQAAIINSNLTRHLFNSNSGSGGGFLAGNSAFMRSPMINVTDLVKTGRNNLYLDTWNDLTGNVYVSEQGGLFARHSGALGVGAAGREVVVSGAGNFFLEYGTNISGINLRVSNAMDASRVVLRNEGATHSTWGGDIIFDTADGAGSTEFQNHVVTARTNGTLSVYGNIYTDNNANFTDNTSFTQSPLLSTAIGESATLNLFGQVRDTITGSLANVGETGDSATRLSRSHSMAFQMRGHDEMNVNVHQQWNATGAIFATQGYFRIGYDPTAAGLDGTGFHTNTARAAITQVNTWNDLWLGGPQNTLGVANSAINAYHGSIMLTRPDQVLNWGQRIQVSNNNRNHALTLGGEHSSGTAYIGSADNSEVYRIIYQNTNTERDLRFLQVAGGTLVVNARLEDTNTTADSFNATVSLVGPGRVEFNRNEAGNSNVDRWNFMAGTAVWGTMSGNNQFARTRGTGTNNIASVSTWGGGHLVLAAQPAARIQTLDGNIYLLNGASSVNAQNNTTFTMGANNPNRSFTRRSGSSLAFLEDGNGAININGGALTTTAGEVLGSWAVYGSSAVGVEHWAARQGTTGVQAFGNYDNDVFDLGNHTNLSVDGELIGDATTATLRFETATQLDLGAGNTLTLSEGALLVPASKLSESRIFNGTLTSSWVAGDSDLMLFNYGQGRLTIDSLIADDGANAVNLVHAGSGTTLLTGANSYSGNTFLNNGVLQISSDAQLGLASDTIARTIAYVSTGTWDIREAGNVHFDGGVLHAMNDMQLDPRRTLFLGGNGGTLRVEPGATLLIDGYISGEYNHVNAANGYTLADGLGGLADRASLRNPDIGDLTIDGGGTVVFRYSPTGDGVTPGSVGHDYGGITWVNEGILRLEGVGSTGLGALGTNRSFLDSTVIGDNGTLSFFFSASDPIIAEWFTVRGQGYQGGGTFASTVIGTARDYNLAGQIHLEEDALFIMRNAHDFNINNGGGDLFGIGNVIRSGNGELRFYGNNPEWKGQLLNASGGLSVNNSGALGGLTGMRMERNTLFQYDADSTAVNEIRDRLPDNLAIATDGWVRMRMNAFSGVFSGIEKMGTITAEAGVLALEYNLGADLVGGQPRLTGDYAGWHFDEIVRSAGSVINVRNLDAGTGFAGAAFGTSPATTTDRAVLMVNTAPAMTGGDGTNFNQMIAPGFFGGAREAWTNSGGASNLFTEEGTARFLMTVEAGVHPETGAAVNYIRPLEMSELRVIGSDSPLSLAVADSTPLTGATGQNVAFVGRTEDTFGGDLFTARRNSVLTLGGDETVNSLSFMTESFVNGAGSGRGNTATMIIDPQSTLTISSGVINIANLGIQDMNGAALNTSVNADIRTFIQGGALNFNGQEAILHANSRWIHYNTAGQVGAFDTVDVDNTQVFINSSIGNTGGNGLTKSGPNSVYLQVANNYTGDTWVNHGLLFARHPQALGASDRIDVTGSGGFLVGLGIELSGVDVHVGLINGNNIVLASEQGSTFNGNVIIDNVDLAGATSHNRNFTPRIYNNSTHNFTMNGDIYGGATPVAAGIRATESRMFSTFTGAGGIFDIRGRIMDNENGALNTLVTEANQNQVLRMEILDTTGENNLQLWQSYESAGRIRLLSGVLRFMGEGNFYSDAAAAAINPANPMSGFQMGGRGVVNSAGTGTANLSFMLANANSTFNLASWEVGVESTDRDNITGNDNFNRGNTTGNIMLGGENRSGVVTFGTGTGGITFVNDERFGGYEGDLRLYAAGGGLVDVRAALLDGGTGVDSSITKVGLGEVRLLGSSLGDSTVEGVNVLGGFLTLTGYDVNGNRRVGNGASLVLGGGGLVLNAGANAVTEDLGDVTVASGGGALVAAGPAANLQLAGAWTVNPGASVHFQSISGGTITATGLAPSMMLGVHATYGASATTEPTATDWAATDASGIIGAFTGYTADVFAPGNHLDVQTADLIGGEATSLRFNDPLGSVTGGIIELSNGGILFTSNYTGGTPIALGVGLNAAVGDLMIQNYATGDVVIAGNVSGSNLVVNGTGKLVLTGVNALTGNTAITGAATLSVGGVEQIGLGNLALNGGTLELSGTGFTSLWSQPITLGGNDGVISITDATSRLILRGAATNMISSEANPVASITTNPFSGGIRFEGAGTVQFGDRSAANNVQDILGVNNNYTGYTTIGDGVNPIRIDIQGQVNSNGQINPFGTHVGWTDATLVRNNATLEFGQRRGDGSRNGQVRVREWFEWGQSAGDVMDILVSTQREVAMEGFHRINGTLNITVQNRQYADRGSDTAANQQTSLYFGLNEGGGLIGNGNIVVHPEPNPAGNSYGSVQFREPMPDFTGDIAVRNGHIAFYGLGQTQGSGTTPILVGTENSANNHRLDVRIYSENGTNGSSTITTAFDAPPTELEFYRDIRIADNTPQDIRLATGYLPANGFVRWSGNIDMGNSPGQTTRLYMEDTENLDPLLTGFQQHVIMDFSGNISGNRNLLIDVNEGGDNNQTLPVEEGGRIASDVHRAIFTTVNLAGDNSGWTGNLVVSAETSTTVIDKDDIPIVRFGSDLAISAQNNVTMQALSGLQVGGQTVTIGNLTTAGGNSTSGLYSFIDYAWAAGRQSLYDLDHVVGTNSGTNGKNISALGGSSEIIENASATAGSLTITQTVDANWDAYFRDGRQDGLINGTTAAGAALSLVKAGDASATLTIFNDYSGTTTVAAGTLRVGVGGTGEWGELTQGNRTVSSALVSGTQLAGTTGTGLTTVAIGAVLAGTGQVRGDLLVNGILSPGDNAGELTGTLFIGDGTGGTLALNMNGTTQLQLLGTPSTNVQLRDGVINYVDEVAYDAFLADVANLLGVAAVDNPLNPTVFGGAGSQIAVGTYDHLEIGGDLVWSGGTINVVAGPGWAPEPGQIYNVLDWYGVADWAAFNVGSNRLLIGNGDDDGNLVLPDLSIHNAALRWDTALFESHGVLFISAPFDVNGPPVIVEDPVGDVLFAQQSITFEVVAIGPGALSYVWLRNGVPISGAPDAPTYVIDPIPLADSGLTIEYSVQVSNANGMVTSAVATLQVAPPIVITDQPVAVEVPEGNVAQFAVVATGDEPFNYQWQLDGVDVVGETASSITVTAGLATVGNYRARIFTDYGAELFSQPAALTLGAADVVIVSQPVSQILAMGDTLQLEAQTSGGLPQTFQWLRNGRPVPGGNQSVLEVPNATTGAAGIYTCRIRNALATGASDVTTNGVVVTVVNRASRQAVLRQGSAVTLSVTAAGHVSDPISYQWFVDTGSDAEPNVSQVAGATARTLRVTNLPAGRSRYFCVISTQSGLELAGGDNLVFGVTDAPVLTQPDGVNLPSTQVSVPYSYQVPLIEGPDAGEADPTRMPAKFVARGLPPGLRIDAAGLISGSALAERRDRLGVVIPYTVTIIASNAAGSVTMVRDLLVNPLSDNVVGAFTGPVDRHPVLNENLGGMINVTTTKRGTYTGRLTMGARSYPIRGSLVTVATALDNPTATAVISRGRNVVPLTVTFSLDATTGLVSVGTITDGVETAGFTGWLNSWKRTPSNRTPAAAYAGYYTVGLNLPAGLESDLTVPQGAGFAAYTVNATTGRLTVSGRLADNTAFTTATYVGPNGEVMVFRTLYSPRARGSVLGSMVVTLAAENANNTVAGTLSWLRPALATSTLYPDGFSLNVLAEGSRYDAPPALTPVMEIVGVPVGQNNAIVQLAGANVETAQPTMTGPLANTVAFRVDERNRAVGDFLTNPRKVQLTITARTGRLTGRFVLEDANPTGQQPFVVKRTVSFQGQIIRDSAAPDGQGVGFFILRQLPGSTVLNLSGLMTLDKLP
jgi:autotransporter-associated beta strand protein